MSAVDSPEAKALSHQRRRLSVQSDNKFIEGVENISLGGRGGRRRSSISIREGEPGAHISRLHGVSKKGYAPYNPRKKNQDALAMFEDPATGTQAILVMDGHGEAGARAASPAAREEARANRVLFLQATSCRRTSRTSTATRSSRTRAGRTSTTRSAA